jgi:hypothetical protein
MAAWHSTTHATWHTWHTTWHSSWSTCSLVDSHHNWVEFSFKFFLFGIDFSSSSFCSAFEELETLFADIFNNLLVFGCELVL